MTTSRVAEGRFVVGAEGSEHHFLGREYGMLLDAVPRPIRRPKAMRAQHRSLQRNLMYLARRVKAERRAAEKSGGAA
jgi:hypothetical protein